MSKIRRINLANLFGRKQEDLESLIERFLEKSEELESRETRVLRQVELVQSAVASLQAWNQNRRNSATVSEPVRIDVNEIEEETKRIREETKRIQKEVREKIESNKKLQDEIDRKRMIEGGGRGGVDVGETMTDDFFEMVDEDTVQMEAERQLIASREELKASTSPKVEQDLGIQFFNQKLNKLKEMERNLRRESKEESELAKIRKKKIKEKIEMLEWESELDRQMIQALRTKYGRK